MIYQSPKNGLNYICQLNLIRVGLTLSQVIENFTGIHLKKLKGYYFDCLKAYKKYLNKFTYIKRLNIFKKNLAKINELNEKYNNGTLTYMSGITKFSDWVNYNQI